MGFNFTDSEYRDCAPLAFTYGIGAFRNHAAVVENINGVSDLSEVLRRHKR